jgi:hypothetical protein
MAAQLSAADVNNAPSPHSGAKSPVKTHHKSNFMLKYPHELVEAASRSVHT